MTNLIGSDITLMRNRYDEALQLQGIPCKYQYPIEPDSNAQGESVADGYSDYIDTHIFFDSNPKVKTYKRLGWVLENDKDLPFLIHCSFHLENLQKDSLFTLSGQYTGMPDRVFRVLELTCDIQAPDHMIAQVVPIYGEDKPAGRTRHEVAETYNSSTHFLKSNVDYRGNYRSELPGD